MKRSQRLATLLVMLACALPAIAQSSDETAKRFHVFPQIADGGGWQSVLLVTNASQSTSLCTLELHGVAIDRFEDIGTTATGSTATFSLIAPAGYLVWPTKNESALASGYATLDCTVPTVAQVLYGSRDGSGTTTGMATVFSSQAGGVFQFPVLTPEASLGIAIANDTNTEASCRFVLKSPERQNLGQSTLPVPSQSNVARFLYEVIQVPGGFTEGSVTVSCDQRVSVIGLQFEGAIFTTLPPAILDLPPQPSDETAKRFHVFPQIADGGGWQSVLLVTNVAQSTSLCTLELHGLTIDRFEDIGTTATGSTATFSLIAPAGYLVWPTKNESALASGYATLDCTDPVVAQVLYASKDGPGTTTGIATVFSSQAGEVFQFPVLTPEATLGFAIANDTNSEASCRTVLQDPQRVNLGEGTLSVPPKSNVARFLHEVIPIPRGFTRGLATVSCNQPVAMIGLHFELDPDGAIITFNTLPPAVIDPVRLTVTLSAAPNSIEPGETAMLTWSSTKAVSAAITPDIGDVEPSGSLEVSPRVTTTYRITATAADGETAEASTTVTVAVVGVSDRAVLTAFYEATGGPNWGIKANWLTERPISEWEGVTVDDSGRVTSLWVAGNNLTGPIPPELGALTNLEYLILSDNHLTGPIPPELGALTQLRDLNLSNGASFIFLGVPGQLTGPIPPELGALTNLEYLELGFNKLTGPIPPELGNLANLQVLPLYHNELSGTIPPELGALTQLRKLWLSDNQLTGPIPPELGALTNLQELDLGFNKLTGPIPPELASLRSMSTLQLRGNDLTGSIPPELGQMLSLVGLYLESNNLTGPIPPELGRLRYLWRVYLDDNDLTGPIPPEIGEWTNLRRLRLSRNTRMSGALPVDLVRLDQLEELLTVETDLCAPSEAVFRDWLVGVQKQRLQTCDEPPAVYLTQAVQSRRFPVALVAGEKALLRVFVTAPDAGGETMPPVRARFYLDGQEVHAADIPGGAAVIPAAVEEGSLADSANALVPDHVVQPGLELEVEIDPEGTLEPGLGVTRRIPETGRLRVDVRAAPAFDLTVIPFILRSNPDTSIVERVEAMESDPEGHELLWDTRSLLPIGDLAVTAHESVMVDTDNAHRLLAETRMIHTMEGASGHYMGTIAGAVSGGAAGVAYFRGKTSFVTPDSFVIAHELGHNFGLMHAPCSTERGLDRVFPNADGSIGVWGYDFREGGRLVSPDTPDMMSFCPRPLWISDYHFTNALGFRLREAAAAGTPQGTSSARSLLLWGGVDGRGAPFLEPAFVVDAPASLPSSTGDYRIVGRTADGGELFSLAFEMPEVGDGDGRSSFAFAVPVEPGWTKELTDITLSGSGGSVTLDKDTNRPVTILRNRRTGQIRGILRNSPVPAETRDTTASALSRVPGAEEFGLRQDPDVEVLTSNGLPDPEDWMR